MEEKVDCLSQLVQSTIFEDHHQPQALPQATSPAETSTIGVHFVKQPPGSVRKINFFSFSVALFEVEHRHGYGSVSKPLTVLESAFLRFIGYDDGSRNGALYQLRVLRHRTSSSSSSDPDLPEKVATEHYTEELITLQVRFVDSTSKALVLYEGSDRAVELQRVLLTHTSICSRCSAGKSCGNERGTPSAPLISTASATLGTSTSAAASPTTLTFFLRCNQNCFQSGGSSVFSAKKRLPRRRKFQLAVSVVDHGNAATAYSTEFFVHNSSKALTGGLTAAAAASGSPHSTTSFTSSTKRLKKNGGVSSSSAQAEMKSSPEGTSPTSSEPFSLLEVSPKCGPPGTEVHLLGRHFPGGLQSTSTLEVLLLQEDGKGQMLLPLKPLFLNANLLKVTIPWEMASLAGTSLRVRLIDRATGVMADSPISFLLEEDPLWSSFCSPAEAAQMRFQLSRIDQLLQPESSLPSAASSTSSQANQPSSLSSAPGYILNRGIHFFHWYNQFCGQLQQQQQQQQQLMAQQAETVNSSFSSSFPVTEAAALPSDFESAAYDQFAVVVSPLPSSSTLPPSLPPLPSTAEEVEENAQLQKQPQPTFTTLSPVRNSDNKSGLNRLSELYDNCDYSFEGYHFQNNTIEYSHISSSSQSVVDSDNSVAYLADNYAVESAPNCTENYLSYDYYPQQQQQTQFLEPQQQFHQLTPCNSFY